MLDLSDDDSGAWEVLREEVIAGAKQSPGIWLAELLLVFTNQMPYYHAPHGLELGPVLVSAEELATGLNRIGDRLSESDRPIRVVGKLRSGLLVADRIEARLRNNGADVQRVDVKTRWDGFSTATIVEEHGWSGQLDRRLNVVCDTMVGTGVTAATIGHHADSRGGGDEFLAVAPVHIVRPHGCRDGLEVLTVKTFRGYDWTVGFGSDADHNGQDVLRGLPFIASLRPVGLGFRQNLFSAVADLCRADGLAVAGR